MCCIICINTHNIQALDYDLAFHLLPSISLLNPMIISLTLNTMVWRNEKLGLDTGEPGQTEFNIMALIGRVMDSSWLISMTTAKVFKRQSYPHMVLTNNVHSSVKSWKLNNRTALCRCPSFSHSWRKGKSLNVLPEFALIFEWYGDTMWPNLAWKNYKNNVFQVIFLRCGDFLEFFSFIFLN